MFPLIVWLFTRSFFITDAETLDLTKEPAYRFRYVIQRRIVRTIKSKFST